MSDVTEEKVAVWATASLAHRMKSVGVLAQQAYKAASHQQRVEKTKVLRVEVEGMLRVCDALIGGSLTAAAVCGGCGGGVDVSKRTHKPQPGQNVWCDDCRAKGAHKRASARRKRTRPLDNVLI